MKDWRLTTRMSMSKAAMLMGLANARAYHRYETGENRPDAHVVDRIIEVTQGAVGLEDLHQQRLSWLREHSPRLFGEIQGDAAQ